MDNSKKYMVIDYLYNLNLELVKEYSLSIYNSLNVGWQNYVANKDSGKNKKYKEKLEKNLDKLSKKERLDKSFIDKTLECIDELQKASLLNSRYKNSLISNIKNVKSLSEYFKYLLNKYDEMIEFENRKEIYNKRINIPDMPLKINCKEYCVQDNNGYYYYHVKKVNGNMVVVPSSLKAEKQLYKNALENNKEVFKEINNDIKLSPFERKRRIYIDNVFQLDRLIKQLYEKNVDIAHPIEKYYLYSDKIVDGLYYELNRDIEKKDIFDYIMNTTVDNFSYEEVANRYSKCVKKLNSGVKKLDSSIIDILNDESVKLKSKGKYSLYSNISGLVPSVGDIYNIVNKKIISSLKRNYKDNILKVNDIVNSNTRYMNENDIIEYYNEYKDVLTYNKCNIELFKVLQKSIVEVLSKKYHIDKKKVFEELLKEAKIF